MQNTTPATKKKEKKNKKNTPNKQTKKKTPHKPQKQTNHKLNVNRKRQWYSWTNITKNTEHIKLKMSNQIRWCTRGLMKSTQFLFH